jgi:hypothetical protein
MIWELAQDHHANQPDPLLQAVKQALATPGTVAIQLSVPDIYLSFMSAPLGFYNVQWTSNLTSGIWNTLIVTNVAGTGGVMQVADPGAVFNQPDRFYRVRTPP